MPPTSNQILHFLNLSPLLSISISDSISLLLSVFILPFFVHLSLFLSLSLSHTHTHTLSFSHTHKQTHIPACIHTLRLAQKSHKHKLRSAWSTWFANICRILLIWSSAMPPSDQLPSDAIFIAQIYVNT